MKLKGGSLKPPEIKMFLQASYEEKAPPQINDYMLDEKLSNLYGKVYVNEKLKKVVLAFRGTGMENLGTDWLNNLVFAFDANAYRLTPRYNTAVKMYNGAMKKYKGYKFELVGHSQSGVIVNNLCSDKVQNCISLNPAYKNASLKDNEYIIRSTGDIVSKLAAPKKYLNSVLYPNWTKQHMIFLEDKTGNPITEHKPDILDRLDDNKKIGRGAGFGRTLKGYTINDELSGGCHCDEMKGGARASNPWVEHVKKYAKENNMTYACAILEAKKTYTKVDKNAKKNEMIEVLKKKWRSDINKNFTTVLRANPGSLPSLRLKFKTRNKGYREYMQQVAPKMYIKLTEKIGKSN